MSRIGPPSLTSKEVIQDNVGNILTDSASIDFTYDDTNNEITAAVLPAGVDHDALNNFVANEHIDHTSVTLTAGTGLSGGGDISTNRTFNLDHLGIEDLSDPGADRVFFWDDSETKTDWLTVGTGLQIVTTTLSTKDSEINHDQLLNFAANEHFTEASIDHTAIQNIGTNTHAQIDTHLASTANPHSVTAAQAGAIADSTDTVKDTHIDWGTGESQVSADDIPDGSTNAIITLTQETNFGTAYTHSQIAGGDSVNRDLSQPLISSLLHHQSDSGGPQHGIGCQSVLFFSACDIVDE